MGGLKALLPPNTCCSGSLLGWMAKNEGKNAGNGKIHGGPSKSPHYSPESSLSDKSFMKGGWIEQSRGFKIYLKCHVKS